MTIPTFRDDMNQLASLYYRFSETFRNSGTASNPDEQILPGPEI